jgi:hypothetical protein
MNAVKALPAHYEHHATYALDQRRFIIWFNILSIPLFIGFGGCFLLVTILFRPGILETPLTTGEQVSGLLGVLVLIVLGIILHELIHGFFFWRYTGERPRLGFKGAYAFAGAPDWYLPRNQFFLTTIAPFVMMTSAGLIFILFGSFIVVISSLLIITINAAGSIGDFYIAIKLLQAPETTLCNDSGPRITLYRPSPTPT